MSVSIDRRVYPFEGRRFDRGGGIRMHYLDEGPRDAPPIVMVHGNPSWSIYFRALVLALRETHRCIVPDHVGMGLSDKPNDVDYEYTLASRIDDLGKLLDHLGVNREITLVVHDWGGGIGFGWATRHADRVARLVVLNTAAFHLPQSKTFPAALRLTRTPLGALMVRGGNAFARGAAYTCVTRKPMSPELRRAYLAPYSDWSSRIATLRFVQDIPLQPSDRAYARIDEMAAGLAQFRQTPTLIAWGMRDFVFDHHFLAEWEKRMPHAEVHRFEDAGHYVLEDVPEVIVLLVKRFLADHPLARERAA
ncbi:Haloalkane dehalogenase-like protein [Sandaracinus amylolyticus]|uniref:Haloalkane dehalogenase-like protein n=2 Tax=Sandaracinus amylolyticus TaxID=927083 RepID=A0A0F6W4H7_9BACT|nr:alpha/beta fold hydrolase [Sandaracinus amylolyticus]AKF07268.1 Haloalkane dehalogenase-like protein [Sandaracinus amylolyticus]